MMETVGLKTMTCETLKKGSFLKKTQKLKLGAGFSCMFINTLASNNLLLYCMVRAALPSAYSTMEFTKYLGLWGDIGKTFVKCAAGKQGVCQHQKVYKYLLKCFPCGVSFTFGCLKVSLSFVWYNYLWKGRSNFPVLHLQKIQSLCLKNLGQNGYLYVTVSCL